MRALRLALGIICIAGPVSPVRAQTAAAIQTTMPIASSTVAPNRIALTILPKPAAASARAALAQADEEAYRKRLRELGFEVRTIAAANRLDLDRTLREAALGIPAGSDVAVLLLGNALALDGDIRIVPADASSDLANAPDRLETESLRLSDFLRRISTRLPRNLVVIVDECSELGPATGKCSSSESAGSGASIVSAYRRPNLAAADRSLSNVLSLRTGLVSLMTREGMTFSQLNAELGRQLSGSNLALDLSDAQSENFAFLPRGFFGGVSNECNQVDLAPDPALIRSVDLDPPQRACEKALTTWPYATHFADRLAAVKEQRAYQRAVASCNDPVARSAFETTYPASRFRRVSDAFWTTCVRPPTPLPLPLPTPLPDPPRRTPQQAANSFLERYYYVSSSAGEAAGARLGELFAPYVNFYGQQKSSSQIVFEKLQYNERWRGRRFMLRPGSVSTSCDLNGMSCRVTGMVEFDFDSPQRNARSRGLSSFEFVFTNVMTSPAVSAESSRVEQRF